MQLLCSRSHRPNSQPLTRQPLWEGDGAPLHQAGPPFLPYSHHLLPRHFHYTLAQRSACSAPWPCWQQPPCKPEWCLICLLSQPCCEIRQACYPILLSENWGSGKTKWLNINNPSSGKGWDRPRPLNPVSLWDTSQHRLSTQICSYLCRSSSF